MAPFSPETAALRAGRTMLGNIRLFARGVCPSPSKLPSQAEANLTLLRKFRAEGYDIHFFFLWLKSVDLALSRVKERVLRGGHDVPEPIIRRRFDRSMQNFILYYRPLAKGWTLFDNSGAIPSVIASESDEKIRIMDKSIYSALVKRYGRP